MTRFTRSALIALALTAAGVATAGVASTSAEAAQCMRAGGWGTGALQNFASFMAEAAMKNSAKAHLGDAVKIGRVNTKCEFNGLLYECTARARACK